MFVAVLVLALIVLLFLVFAVLHTIVGLLLFLVVAALCGAVAEYFLRAKEGVGETLLIGVGGAAIGTLLAHILRLPGLLSVAGVPIIWTIVGSMIVVWILKIATPRPGSLRRLR